MRNRLLRNKCLSAIVGLFLIASVLTACKPQEQPKTVLFVCLTLGNPFYQEMISGLDEGATGIPNIILEKQSGRSPTDVRGQADIIHTFLASLGSGRLAGVILVPADSGAPIANVVRELNDVNVPVINLDIAINETALTAAGAHVDAFIGSDNIAGGREGANVMAKLLPRGGRILVLLGGLGEATTRDRREGFLNRLEELKQQTDFPTSLIERSADWSEAKANVETATLLATGSQIDGIFAENDLMALGAAKAIAARELKKPPVVVGYDAIPEARSAIKNGTLAASISQNPKLMGKRAMEYLQNIWSGSRNQLQREFTPVSVVTRDTP